jgi:hypothetical protein
MTRPYTFEDYKAGYQAFTKSKVPVEQLTYFAVKYGEICYAGLVNGEIRFWDKHGKECYLIRQHYQGLILEQDNYLYADIKIPFTLQSWKDGCRSGIMENGQTFPEILCFETTETRYPLIGIADNFVYRWTPEGIEKSEKKAFMLYEWEPVEYRPENDDPNFVNVK